MMCSLYSSLFYYYFAKQERLCTWSDSLNLDLIMTIGGTGLSSRDVTPEVHVIIFRYFIDLSW